MLRAMRAILTWWPMVALMSCMATICGGRIRKVKTSRSIPGSAGVSTPAAMSLAYDRSTSRG